MQLFSNNASTTLGSDITISDTYIPLATGAGSKFTSPSTPDFELITITQGSNIEVIKVLSKSGDAFNSVVRAQEGTSAYAFTTGAKIEGRVTKGTFDSFVQKDIKNVVIGANSATTKTISEVAIGYSARAGGVGTNQGTGGIAIGDTAQSGATAASTPLRTTSTAYTKGQITRYVIGPDEYMLVCIKSGTTSGSAIGALGSFYYTDGTVRWRVTYLGSGAVATGTSSFAGGDSSIAIGSFSRADGNNSTVVGAGSGAVETSTAIGSGATANFTKATALGYGATVFLEDSLSVSRLPAVGAYPNWSFGSEYQNYVGLDGIVMSEPMDLAGGSTWAATTQYKHGYVVKPTAPNGHQYVRWDNSYDPWSDPDLTQYTASSSSSTQPTWPTVFGNSVTDGGGDWICVKTDGSYVSALPTGSKMVVNEIGFIAYDVSAITVQPTISIGTTGDLTKIASAQTTSGLTSSFTAWKYVPSQPVIVPDITFKVDTLATGTRLLGRFYVKGFLIKHWV